MFLLLLPIYVKADSPSIQQQIDKAKPGGTLELQEGKYKENIIINKPIHLVGLKSVTLTQEKSSPVITIQSDDVTIENVRIRHVDESDESPAILINSDHNSLQDIDVHTNSYGIQLDEANHNQLSRVRIIGDEEAEIKNRKHGIDLWKSNNNKINDTTIQHMQDGIYVERGHTNNIYNNKISKSRYGIHLMFTTNDELTTNESYNNVSGLYIMGAEGTVVKQNILRNNQTNVQSLGLFLFDTTSAIVTENKMVNNRIGIFIEDASENDITLNQIQGNYTGVQMKEAEDNNISYNTFVANVAQGQAKKSTHNHTSENYWGDHLGLDITGDEKSELAYKLNPFFVNITDDYPPFQILFQSPGMVFLEQLISIPTQEQLVDVSPLMENPLAVSKGASVNSFSILFFCITLVICSLFIIYLGVKKNEKI